MTVIFLTVVNGANESETLGLHAHDACVGVVLPRWVEM